MIIESIGQWFEDKLAGFTLGGKLQLKYTDVNAPARCVTLLNRSGGATYFDLKDRADFLLQVLCRSVDINEAEDDAETVRALVHGIAQQPLFKPDLIVPTTNYIPNGNVESWATVNTLNNWTKATAGTSQLNREATIKQQGNYSAKLTVDAGNNLISIESALSPVIVDIHHRLSFWYYQPTAGKTWTMRFYDSGGTYFLTVSGDQGTWNLGSVSNALPVAAAWTKKIIFFRSMYAFDDYKLLFIRNAAASSSLYIDDCILQAPVYEIQTAELMGLPAYIGQDEHGRHMVTSNYVLRIKDYSA